MLAEVENRGGWRGGARPGNYAWSKPKIHYRVWESIERLRYLARWQERLNSLIKIIREPGCQYASAGDSLDMAWLSQRQPLAGGLKPMTTYRPAYPLRYEEYLATSDANSVEGKS